MRLINLEELLEKVPVTRQTIYNWEAEGTFPKRVHLNGDGSRIAWLESEVDEWILKRVAERGSRPAKPPKAAKQKRVPKTISDDQLETAR